MWLRIILAAICTWIQSREKPAFPVVLEAVFQSSELILRTIKPIKVKYFKHLPLLRSASPTHHLHAFSSSCKAGKGFHNLPVEYSGTLPCCMLSSFPESPHHSRITMESCLFYTVFCIVCGSVCLHSDFPTNCGLLKRKWHGFAVFHLSLLKECFLLCVKFLFQQ